MKLQLSRIFASWLIFLAWVSSPAFSQSADPAFLTIDSVDYVIGDSATPPPGTANWQSMHLPLGSRLGNKEDSNRTIWMRFEIDAPSDSELMALYFYRYNLSIDVFFNGHQIGGDTSKAGTQTVSWNHPRLILIQPANWRSNSNIVHVRFQTSYFGGTFSQILFGPADSLQLAYEERVFRQITINQWMQYLGILALVLSLVLWAVRRNDRTYLLFAGMAACWIVLASHMVIYYNPIAYRYWLPLVHLSTDLWGLFLFHFLSRLTALRAPRTVKLLNLWMLGSLSWNIFAPFEYWWLGAYAFHAIGNLFIFYVMARIVRKAVVEREPLAIAICITICVQVSFFLHDYLQILFATPADWESALYYSQFAFPLLMLVCAGALLHRFISALSEAEKLNRELEDRVEASRKIIEQSYEEKHELELKQAAAKERIDIYRDLHDDVGSKLLSIVHADNGNKGESKLGELARSALESLRNAVSRANSPEQPVAEFLRELREEAELRLTGSGHEFSWTQSHNVPDMQLSSKQVFNLNQIFREIVSNIIRHADANSVEIQMNGNDRVLHFLVADNGIGIANTSVTSAGNGLKNINSRVLELNGDIGWSTSQTGGVSIELSIPVSDTVAATPSLS